jgi:hypothetical protein
MTVPHTCVPSPSSCRAYEDAPFGSSHHGCAGWPAPKVKPCATTGWLVPKAGWPVPDPRPTAGWLAYVCTAHANE